MRHVEQLVELEPSFITCTYGAGGSTQLKTLEIADMVKRQFDIPVASHLTCVGATVDELREYLNRAARQGVDYIVALRGDPPRGHEQFRAVEGGFRYANELVALIRDEFPQFGVAVAGLSGDAPGSTECRGRPGEPETQSGVWGRHRHHAAVLQQRRLLPLPQRYEERGSPCRWCRASCPSRTWPRPSGSRRCAAPSCPNRSPNSWPQDDPEWQFQVGVEFATQQVQELLERGVAGLHFYVLNKSQATSSVLRAVKQIG